jgi:uncharacterized Fe-S center protein
MNTKKKINALLLSAVMLTMLFAGCSQTASPPTTSNTPAPSSTQPSSEQTQPSQSSEPTTTPSTSPTTDEQPAGEASVVYMTTDISSEGLMAIYEALGREATGNVAVKVHTGEPGGKNFLQPEFMAPLVQAVNGTFVESNTAYGGQRASTAMHYQVAEDHGFNDVAPMVILDEEDSMPIPMPEGAHFAENLVGARLADFDFLIALSHFKGHAIGGYGGTIKNMSIGIASTTGKNRIHTAGNNDDQWMGGDQDDFLESMAEATLAVENYFGAENVLYINVMNRMSVDCDCSGAMAAEPEVHDIGILASFDPVALDQACIDLIYAVEDSSAESLIQRIESRNGAYVLDHGAKIGLGSQIYEIVSIDE